MKHQSKLSCLPLILLLAVNWSPVDSLCSLSGEQSTVVNCHELEDARYIETYHALVLHAPTLAKSLAPGNFKNFTSLQHLDLSNGKLERIESNSFAKLETLKTLNLANNSISHLTVDAFDGLNQLHSLNLRNNGIEQLPAALMGLKKLKVLNLSGNPLNCDCASLKLRDVLVSRDVKINKQTMCSEPPSAKHLSLMKPDTKTTCLFEKQDREMQGDQPVQDSTEGSGQTEEDEENVDNNETAEEQSKPDEKSEDTAVSQEATSSTTSATSVEVVTPSSAETPSSTAAAKDDITFDSTESSDVGVTAPQNTIDSESNENADAQKNDDLVVSSSTDSSSTAGIFESSTDDSIAPDLGSGEDDDGSGAEGSGIIPKVPPIDYNDTITTSDGEEDDETKASTSSSTSTTETSSSLWWFTNSITSLLPFGGATTEVSETTSEKTVEDVIKDEQFMPVTSSQAPTTTKAVEEPLVPPRAIATDEKIIILPTSSNHPFDTAYSQEANKGMSSYIVLAVLLAILVTLVVIAIYKGDFCRKKSKRRDVERGTEMKDMQKSLLDQNQPKIQVTNGSTMENVPLMTPSSPPEEPKDKQRSYDITPANGSSNRANGPTLDNDSVIKPPRKSTGHEIEAPLNGLNPPMDAIDGPTSESLEGLNGDCCERPPLSPGAQRVKITLNENPDSVKKTPVLITRINDLVTTP